MRKIALIGPMGSGKSTLALQYQAKYGGTVLDTDDAFTARYGDISRYMRANGEDAFRKVEHELVLQAANSAADIISCGGGVVLNKRNMNALRSRCDIVCLTAPIQVLKERIYDSDRPLKGDIEKIVSERAELYRRYADYTIDTSSGDCVQKLSDALSRPRKNRYDILLCDADDTVLDFQKAMRTSIIAAARTVGIQAADEKIVKEFGEASHIVWRKLEDKQIERTELDTLRFSMLKERLNEHFVVSDMSEAFLENLEKTRFLLDGATEFLSAVRERGVKVYILTNGLARVARERLKALDGYTDGAFISEEMEYNKPDPRLFDCVFNALGGVDKTRTLMFGDSVNSDIGGGINSGIETCLFDPSVRKSSEADYTVRTYDELLRVL
ncbi:MAG: HAD-IA family hydrolase [Clostridiales bacterium]|nr:HAD-IA family hydrolase [Clostridiales bacterium]